MAWADGAIELNTARYSPALALLLDQTMGSAVERSLEQITEADLLAMLWQTSWDAPDFLSLSGEQRNQYRRTAALLENSIASGVQQKDCLAAFDVVALIGSDEMNPFERESWRDPLPALLEALPDDATVPDLLSALFTAAPTLQDGDLLTSLFEADRLVRSLGAQSSGRTAFDADGAIADAALTPRARFLIDKALLLAARMGAETCDDATMLLTMIQAKDTYTQIILRRAGINLTSAQFSSYLATATMELLPGATALPATKASLSQQLAAILDAALQQALAVGESAAGERELLGELLHSGEPKVHYLVDDVLAIPLTLVDDLLNELREPDIIEPYLVTDICPVVNLSAVLARDPASAPIARPELTPQIMKIFFRKKHRNVLLHGEHGTGASTMGNVVADALRQGLFPGMRQTQVVQFDLSGLDDTAYTQAAERLLTFMESEPDRIYAVEGFGKYFVEHFTSCARRFAYNSYCLLIFADTAQYTALLTGSEPMNGFLDEIELTEPSTQLTTQMVDKAAERISKEYGVTLNDKAVGATIRMAADYILSARFPAKAIDLLERAAADVAAEAEMTSGASREVDRKAIAKRISTLTGLPVETILGTGQDKDYVDLLSTNLVGQEVAVAKVAGRLDLIQKSLVDKDGPAAVFVFAGLSGTGKTELAKQISQIYSSTHAMISFAMENFKESHSVSGLIGSPPGYTGYEEGGPLINALNRDPYSVVLLDEVEKAHPAVWDPFLNLFGEGTITDAKGVTASGTKAFFVMTSNIGQYEIADMLARGASPGEIEDMVMKLFPQYQHEQAHIPCFRPEFIGRIMRCGGVVAFNALSYEALLGIARHSFSKIARSFSNVHEGRFICDDEVLEHIARTIFDENDTVIREKRPGYLGARRIQQLLDQYVNNKLAEKIRQIVGAPLVRVVWNGHDTELVPVHDNADAEALLAQKRSQLVGRVEQRFSQIVTVADDVFTTLGDDALTRLDRLLSEVGAII